MEEKPLISFDYAIKYLLKDKGDYEIVEGFISALLKSQGFKSHPKGSCVVGLFHFLRKLCLGEAIGIAESYVTAATCIELSGIPTVCAFGCHNLRNVTLSVRKLYPDIRIIIFVDNDHYLSNGNQDISNALESKNSTDSLIYPAIISMI